MSVVLALAVSDMDLDCLEQLPVTRQEILRALKRMRRATTWDIARALRLTHEAVRKHMVELQKSGWVATVAEAGTTPNVARAAGRPSVTYALTTSGDQFFAKRYDGLAITLIDAVTSAADSKAVLTELTDRRVAALQARVRQNSLSDDVEALRSIYMSGDPFIETARDGDDFVLIERNCPFLNVALERPAICSTTVSALRRLSGREVIREERFQDGDGRCVFRFDASTMGSRRRFEREPPRTGQ